MHHFSFFTSAFYVDTYCVETIKKKKKGDIKTSDGSFSLHEAHFSKEGQTSHDTM